MNDLELCLKVVSSKVTSTIALHLTLNISETVRDRGLVPKDHQWEMAYGLPNGHVTDDVSHVNLKCQTRDPMCIPIHLEHNISKIT